MSLKNLEKKIIGQIWGFKKYTYLQDKVEDPKQYQLESKKVYLSFISFSKFGLKYFGPFITLPNSL